MRRFRLLLFALVGVAVLAAGVVYAAVRTNGLSADRAPGVVETAIARRLVLLSIPASARGLTNPNAANADAWRAASDHFAEHCAGCHGPDGRGKSEFAAHMYPPVPDLADPAIQAFSDGALFAIVQHGVRWTGMPAFADHSAEDTWKLVSFIRQVPKLPPAGTGGHAAHGIGDHANIISMDGTAFEPRELEVKAGETVVWINKDPFPHNVSSASGGIHSGDLDPDRQWQFRPTRPGTYSYVCTLHPGMNGRLIVTK
jgi:plastocyanin/mono/diheme cytochrome c family protein